MLHKYTKMMNKIIKILNINNKIIKIIYIMLNQIILNKIIKNNQIKKVANNLIQVKNYIEIIVTINFILINI
jgi:hypothetical protein